MVDQHDGEEGKKLGGHSIEAAHEVEDDGEDEGNDYFWRTIVPGHGEEEGNMSNRR